MENGPGLKMYFLLNMGIFHSYVRLPEGIQWTRWYVYPVNVRVPARDSWGFFKHKYPRAIGISRFPGVRWAQGTSNELP